MKFVIKDSKDKQSLINYLKELGNDYIVEVKKQRNNRSNMQNNYYWKCIVQTLAEEIGYFPADQIRIWALTELGIRLMLPNEYN